MSKKILMIVLTLLTAIACILLTARYPTGPNTVSYDDPAGLFISIGMVVVLFLPPFLLAFFQHSVVRTISAIYQGFIAIAFIGLIPGSFFANVGISVTITAIIGTLISIASIFVTLFAGKSKNTYGF
ncbi:hypothetical protein [Oceanobacillus jeddahense]|uniref:Integral inner membrane protein n=1 Tax=Oceanobacillus jeddahense TaxID=1462527 RepID=A0ABY5JZ94_9BACI|nr:hypothetical protein [Oceanobacillus jeddahense]UUI04478.1 hypothetical protein NP439_07440 [Oceanobacillus jeddahense]